MGTCLKALVHTHTIECNKRNKKEWCLAFKKCKCYSRLFIIIKTANKAYEMVASLKDIVLGVSSIPSPLPWKLPQLRLRP